MTLGQLKLFHVKRLILIQTLSYFAQTTFK